MLHGVAWTEHRPGHPRPVTREGRASQAEMGVGRAGGKNTDFRPNRVQIPPLPPCDFEKAIGSL